MQPNSPLHQLMATVYSILPLTAIIVLTMLFWRVQSPLRLVWVITGFITILCCISDWVLLARLPHLGLSFGPVSPSLFMINFIRLILILVAFSLIASSVATWQRIGISLVVGLIQVLFLAILYNGLYIEPFHLTVTEVHIPQAPAFLPDRPLRILQISDLHLEHITSRELAMLEKAKTLTPDLIVMTGDYLNRSFLKDPQTLQETRRLLSQLHAPYGVYAINGNSDKPSIMTSLFDGIDNIRVLDDEIMPIIFQSGTLYLIGGSTIDHNRDYVKIESLMTELPPDVYSVLLYHNPERVDIASASGVDVFLAGHTHGGQVRLPLIGTVTVSQWVNPFTMGKYQVGPTTLFVSRGLGMQGGIWPRIRLNCPPEMVLVSLGK
jgi:hypothetical protein